MAGGPVLPLVVTGKHRQYEHSLRRLETHAAACMDEDFPIALAPVRISAKYHL